MAVIELVQLGITVLSAQLDTVLADDPGEIVSEVTSDVVTALRRRFPSYIEATDIYDWLRQGEPIR